MPPEPLCSLPALVPSRLVPRHSGGKSAWLSMDLQGKAWPASFGRPVWFPILLSRCGAGPQILPPEHHRRAWSISSSSFDWLGPEPIAQLISHLSAQAPQASDLVSVCLSVLKQPVLWVSLILILEGYSTPPGILPRASYVLSPSTSCPWS